MGTEVRGINLGEVMKKKTEKVSYPFRACGRSRTLD